MPVEDEALKSIEGLNDKEISGRNLIVKKANPKSSQHLIELISNKPGLTSGRPITIQII